MKSLTGSAWPGFRNACRKTRWMICSGRPIWPKARVVIDGFEQAGLKLSLFALDADDGY
jgi:hypothetical protein